MSKLIIFSDRKNEQKKHLDLVKSKTMKVVKYSAYLVQISLFLGLVMIDSVTAQESRRVKGVEQVEEVRLFPNNTDSTPLLSLSEIKE